jgi:gluconokinase
MVAILMGVAGAGKTTIGRMLARKLGWEFHDADELHPAANIDKMRRGIALSDADREPWLDGVRALVQGSLERGANAVIACSALKQSYRDKIVTDPSRVKIVYLKLNPATAARRVQERAGHYFKAALLPSQFDALEEPRDAIVVDASARAEAVVASIRRALGA